MMPTAMAVMVAFPNACPISGCRNRPRQRGRGARSAVGRRCRPDHDGRRPADRPRRHRGGPPGGPPGARAATARGAVAGAAAARCHRRGDGGLEPASTYISTALQAGRQVITANKQLVAAQGPPLACLGPLRFEASVASAIPIVETLADALGADRIGSIMGILNGTTNSMLAAMGGGASYADALADAQRRGLGAADRT